MDCDYITDLSEGGGGTRGKEQGYENRTKEETSCPFNHKFPVS